MTSMHSLSSRVPLASPLGSRVSLVSSRLFSSSNTSCCFDLTVDAFLSVHSFFLLFRSFRFYLVLFSSWYLSLRLAVLLIVAFHLLTPSHIHRLFFICASFVVTESIFVPFGEAVLPPFDLVLWLTVWHYILHLDLNLFAYSSPTYPSSHRQSLQWRDPLLPGDFDHGFGRSRAQL